MVLELERSPSRLGLDAVAPRSPLRAFPCALRARLCFPFPFPFVAVAATAASSRGCDNFEDDLVTLVVGSGFGRERDLDFLGGGGRTSAGSSDVSMFSSASSIERLVRMEPMDWIEDVVCDAGGGW